MVKTYIVLTENRRMFEQYLKDKASKFFNTDDKFIYGGSIEIIRGLSANDIIIYGEFWEREDAFELHEIAKSRIKDKYSR